MRIGRSLLASMMILLASSLLALADNAPQPKEQSQFPPTYMPSGEHLYQQFCAACHGADAKGHGPTADLLKRPPSDLTKLAERRGNGKFPYEYVASVLTFGPGVTAHGSSDMPTWGPIFLYLEKHNEEAARARVKRLSEYLASIQEK